jgi:hypothetical protein
MSNNFSTIVVCDFEYEVADGDLPNVLCMVAHVLDEHLQHVWTIRLWRGEFGTTPPFDIGPDTLFIAYSAWAEMTCFKVLGWRFPTYIFDEHTAYLAATNILLPHEPDEKRTKQRKRLEDACRAYDLEGWRGIDKETISKAIGDGTWRGRYSPQEIVDYCEEDVRMETRLLYAQLRPLLDTRGRVLLPAADVRRVLWWSNYSAKAVALIQARGMPIDTELSSLVQENKAAVIGELLRQFDPSHGDEDPIYTPDGAWSYGRFEQWLARSGVTAWPRLDSGALKVDSDAFGMMAHVPGIEGLHALRDSLNFIVKARLPIGQDGRNRPSLFPFGTATGRNAHAKSLYNVHAGMRGGDIYYALARLCNLTDDPESRTLEEIRPRGAAADEEFAAGDQLRDGRALPGARARPASADRQLDHRAPPANLSPLLGVARRHGADRDAGAPHRERVRLAPAHQH